MSKKDYEDSLGQLVNELCRDKNSTFIFITEQKEYGILAIAASPHTTEEEAKNLVIQACHFLDIKMPVFTKN